MNCRVWLRPGLGDPQFVLPPARSYLVLRWRSGEQHAQSISRPGQLQSNIESKGGSCSDIIELDTQLLYEKCLLWVGSIIKQTSLSLTQLKTLEMLNSSCFMLSYLPSSGIYKVLELSRDLLADDEGLLTDILTVKTYSATVWFFMHWEQQKEKEEKQRRLGWKSLKKILAAT